MGLYPGRTEREKSEGLSWPRAATLRVTSDRVKSAPGLCTSRVSAAPGSRGEMPKEQTNMVNRVSRWFLPTPRCLHCSAPIGGKNSDGLNF